MPSAKFQHRARSDAGPVAAWGALQDPGMWATVSGVDTISDHNHRGAYLVGFDFTTSIAGVAYRGTASVTESRPPETMTISIRSSEVTGSIRVVITPDTGGSWLDVEMRIQPAGLMGTMIFPIVTSAVAGGFDDSVERLAARMSAA